MVGGASNSLGRSPSWGGDSGGPWQPTLTAAGGRGTCAVKGSEWGTHSVPHGSEYPTSDCLHPQEWLAPVNTSQIPARGDGRRGPGMSTTGPQLVIKHGSCAASSRSPVGQCKLFYIRTPPPQYILILYSNQ